MCKMYAVFDDLLSQLGRLAERRASETAVSLAKTQSLLKAQAEALAAAQAAEPDPRNAVPAEQPSPPEESPGLILGAVHFADDIDSV